MYTFRRVAVLVAFLFVATSGMPVWAENPPPAGRSVRADNEADVAGQPQGQRGGEVNPAYTYDEWGRLWLCDRGGNWQLAIDTRQMYVYDSQGRLWFQDYGGTWLPAETYPAASQTMMYDRLGRLWIAKPQGGWYLVLPETQRPLSPTDPLGEMRIWRQPPTFYDNMGRLWVQDSSGMWRQSTNMNIAFPDRSDRGSEPGYYDGRGGPWGPDGRYYGYNRQPAAAWQPGRPSSWRGPAAPGAPMPEASDVYDIPTRPEDVNWLQTPGTGGTLGGKGWISDPGTASTFGTPPATVGNTSTVTRLPRPTWHGGGHWGRWRR